MKRRAVLKSAGVLGSILSVGLAGCASSGGGSDQEPTDAPTTVASTTAAPTPTETAQSEPTVQNVAQTSDQERYTVKMTGGYGRQYFNPVGLYINSGNTVEFVLDSGEHTTTAYEDRLPADAEAWDSGLMEEKGAVFERTFEVPGTYDYYSKPAEKAGMVGRIVVDQPGGPAEEQPLDVAPLPPGDIVASRGWIGFALYKGLCC
jgi:plastocyanin